MKRLLIALFFVSPMALAAPSEDVCVTAAADAAAQLLAAIQLSNARIGVEEMQASGDNVQTSYDRSRRALEALGVPAEGGFQLLFHRAANAANSQLGCDIDVGANPQ